MKSIPLDFSILISIYHKEKPEYFHRAMESVWDEQKIKPNEIILVEDGSLTDELYALIEQWKKILSEKLTVIDLKKNVGLGEALNIGLEHCQYELVARMDTDDIAAPDRFEKQLEIFKNSDIDICGSWISEFERNETNILSLRKVPESHQEIISFAKKRNPLNHPSVMFKKSKVLDAGGYQTMLWFEDYYLWVRMILKGVTFYNIQESLVNMRAGYSQLERRSGFRYAMSELAFQQELWKIEFINTIEFLRNISIRFIARIVPKSMVKLIYKRLRK